jgi:hypothetical protein
VGSTALSWPVQYCIYKRAPALFSFHIPHGLMVIEADDCQLTTRSCIHCRLPTADCRLPVTAVFKTKPRSLERGP